MSTDAVRKRQTCVIAPFRHARKRFGEPLARYARLRTLMDLSKLFRKLRCRCAWQVVRWGVLRGEEGPQARIARISGPMPMIRMTRLRL